MISTIAFGQNKQSTKKKISPDKPVVLSSWIRDAGMHYLELVDKSLRPGDLDSDFYDKALDDLERSLNIDAQGADKVFVEKVLKQVRALSQSNLLSVTRTN